MQTNNRALARDIERAVADWNKATKGTALEIKNFRANSMRALREAKMPASERLRKGTPIAARPDVDRIADVLSY
jgi:hypothetical protein